MEQPVNEADPYSFPRYPLLIVVSGPAGVGKDALLKRMRELAYPLHCVVTATDRAPRRDEVHGVDYFFLSTEQFLRMEEEGELLEHALVYEQHKGVPKQQVRDALASGRDVIMRVDVLHIAFNSYALTVFGPQVERPYGRLRFLIMYLLSGLAGSALSFLLSPRPSVGASGAIFGLIGVMGAYLFRYRDRLVAGRARLGNILSVVGYNLIYGFIAVEVDNWAHIGGLLGGLALGWFLAPRYQVVQPDPMGPPQLEDRGSAAHWLGGVALVGLAIGIVIAGGFLRWGS